MPDVRKTSAEATVQPPDATLFAKIEQLCKFLQIVETPTELQIKVVDPKNRTVILDTGKGRLHISGAGFSLPKPK